MPTHYLYRVRTKRKSVRKSYLPMSLLRGSGIPWNKNMMIQQSHAIAWGNHSHHLASQFEIYQISKDKTKQSLPIIYPRCSEAGDGPLTYPAPFFGSSQHTMCAETSMQRYNEKSEPPRQFGLFIQKLYNHCRIIAESLPKMEVINVHFHSTWMTGTNELTAK